MRRLPLVALVALALAPFATPAAASPIATWQISVVTDPIYQNTDVLLNGTIAVAANSPDPLFEKDFGGAVFHMDPIIQAEYVLAQFTSLSGFGVINPGESITFQLARFAPFPDPLDPLVPAQTYGNIHAFMSLRSGLVDGNTISWTVQPGVVVAPEPATLGMFGVAGIAAWVRRRRMVS